MNALAVDRIADTVIDAFPKLSAPEQRVALATYRLLAEGKPPTVEQIAVASGTSRDRVDEMLARWHGVQRAPNGAVSAFWGLTLSKTKHRFRIDARELHTWCAWDTLFLPPLLGETADVDSACPASGAPIALRVSPGGIESAQPQTAVLSFVMPSEAEVERNVIETFCCHVHFFACAEAARPWQAARPATVILSLAEGWHIGVRKNSAQYHAVALA